MQTSQVHDRAVFGIRLTLYCSFYANIPDYDCGTGINKSWGVSHELNYEQTIFMEKNSQSTTISDKINPFAS